MGGGSILAEHGQVRDLYVRHAGYDTLEIGFDLEAINQSEHQIGLYVDGELNQLLDGTATDSALAGLADGLHSLEAFVEAPGSMPPDRHGADYGARAWIKWPRSTDASTRGYKVYWDAGTDGNPDTLLATVSTMTIQRQRYALPDTGTGTGRVSFFGDFPAAEAAINAQLTLTIGAAGIAAFALGDTTGNVTIDKGSTVALCSGVWCTFHDDPDDYVENDAWTCDIGPKCEYLTSDLDADVYAFAVKAVDAAGNPSTALATRKVRIYDVPVALPSLATSYNAGTGVLSVTWNGTTAAAAGIETVRIYANYDSTLSLYADYIAEEAPAYSAAVAAAAIAFPATMPNGTLRFFVRPVGTNGVERKDMVLWLFNYPATAEDRKVKLGTPTNLKATPIAGGDVTFTWDYDQKPSDAATCFLLSWAETATFDWNSPSATVLIGTGTGFPVLSFAKTLGSDFETLGWAAVHIAVRASNGSGVLGPIASTSCTPDATPPAFAGSATGLQQ